MDSDDRATLWVIGIICFCLLVGWVAREIIEYHHRQLELEAIQSGVKLPPRDTEDN